MFNAQVLRIKAIINYSYVSFSTENVRKYDMKMDVY